MNLSGAVALNTCYVTIIRLARAKNANRTARKRGKAVEFAAYPDDTDDAMRMTETKQIRLRLAVPEDVPVLHKLIQASVRHLQAEDYTPAQIEGALATVFGVDSQLIADGTYIVAEAPCAANASGGAADAKSSWTIVGCGGWSKRKTLYGSDHWTGREDALLDPQHDAAKIRAFFIHPDWARQGVGSKILQACEEAARAAGFTRYEMGATLTGAKLFRAKGYVPVKPISIPLNNGETLPVIHMEKQA